jgi:hypothetical protein
MTGTIYGAWGWVNVFYSWLGSGKSGIDVVCVCVLVEAWWSEEPVPCDLWWEMVPVLCGWCEELPVPWE